jgi:hypothetical protein
MKRKRDSGDIVVLSPKKPVIHDFEYNLEQFLIDLIAKCPDIAGRIFQQYIDNYMDIMSLLGTNDTIASFFERKLAYVLYTLNNKIIQVNQEIIHAALKQMNSKDLYRTFAFHFQHVRHYSKIIDAVFQMDMEMITQQLISECSRDAAQLTNDVMNVVCAHERHLPLLNILIGKSVKNSSYRLGFISACTHGNDKAVKLLLAAPHLNLTDEEAGEKALNGACHGNHESIIQLIFDDSRFNISNEEICQQLRIACRINRPKIVEVLLAQNPIINPREFEWVFKSVCRNGHTNIMYQFIQHGGFIDKNTVDARFLAKTLNYSKQEVFTAVYHCASNDVRRTFMEHVKKEKRVAGLRAILEK